MKWAPARVFSGLLQVAGFVQVQIHPLHPAYIRGVTSERFGRVKTPVVSEVAHATREKTLH
ncbi:MAG: hypothetical protein ACYC7C_05350, partial [Coriobacteriia bacterium]